MNGVARKFLKSATMLLGLLLVWQPVSALAATPAVKVKSLEMNLQFDGRQLVLPENQYLFIVNNTSYVPVRFISYALQQSVVWDAKTRTVVIKEPTEHEKITLQERLLNATGQAGNPSSVGGQRLSVTPVAAKFQFNGVDKPIPSGLTAYNLNGSIYVPVRFLSESIGTRIVWDKKTGSITGASEAYAGTKTSQGENGSAQSGVNGQPGQAGQTGGPTNPKPGADEPGQADQPGSGTPGVPGLSGPSGPTGPAGPAGPSGPSDAKPSYASITSNAESRLNALKSSCETQLWELVPGLLSARDNGNSTEVERYMGLFDAKVESCTTQFNSIVAEVEQQLVSNGYSTAIIGDYRRAFEDYLNTGRVMLEMLL